MKINKKFIMVEEKVHGLAISITNDLLTELLVTHIKSVPPDIEVVGMDFEWFNQSIKVYFKSKHFPVVDGRLKANCVTGRIEVSTDKDAKVTGIKLVWKDPDKKWKNLDKKERK